MGILKDPKKRKFTERNLMSKLAKINLKSPLWIFLIYIFVTLSITAWGPVDFEGFILEPVLIYLLFFSLFFASGYYLGTIDIAYDHKVKKAYNHNQTRRLSEILLFTKACIILVASVRLAEVAVFLGQGGNIQPSNLGEAYSAAYEGYERNTGSYSPTFLLRIAIYIPYISSIVLGIYYWNKLERVYRAGIIAVFLSVIITETLGHGKQKQVGDFLIFIIVSYYLSMDHTSKGLLAKFYKVSGSVGLAGLVGFVIILKSRYEAIGVSGLNVNDNLHRLLRYNTDHIVFEWFGPIWGFALSVFSAYLSQGWYGLSLGMQLPFKWTYGIGNSYSMTVLLSRFGNLPLRVEDSYPYRIGQAYGWGESKWHSAVSWFASDFTFAGTLFFFGIVAWVWSRCYKEALLYRNPVSALLFTFLTLGIIFIPANNQLLHTPESALTIIALITAWIFLRGRYNFRKI